ncbi:hypothetical protein GCM10009117_25810 [Gangjinia marincola]|uniref:Uncharacterized protein n=1 Tax=Gangjinia marincola TaxID=578463 RepID=A0ABN1MKN5_9FLAO
MKTLLITLFLGLVFLHTSFNNKTVDLDFNRTKTHSASLVNNDSLVFAGVVYTYELFKNKHTQLYILKDKKGQTLLKDLHYFGQINGGFQALNHSTEIEYYDYNLKLLTSPPEPETYFVCGNVGTYLLTIEKIDDTYVIKKAEGFTSLPKDKDKKVIASLNSKGIKDICFLNETRTLQYDDNTRASEIIVIHYDNSYGIWDDGKITRYDNVFQNTFPIKVMKNNQYGYYGITNGTPYSSLGNFEYSLAPFEKSNGEIGFIHLTGKEYIKSEG